MIEQSPGLARNDRRRWDGDRRIGENNDSSVPMPRMNTFAALDAGGIGFHHHVAYFPELQVFHAPNLLVLEPLALKVVMAMGTFSASSRC
ncbi:MAG: hypothetical protein IPP18_11975 [Rhodocyclaceae bacterium]|nr:hypothetical protein [Rhodocyclaceae bacterium]